VSGAPAFAVVGHPNKGKSSIVATLAQDDSVRIAPEPGTTTECRAYPMRVDGEVQYVLVDTPGFQRARRALDWMRARETHAGAHRAVVEAFVTEHLGSGRFPDECELLGPVLAGAGILYVADGARPYGPDFEAEMEILRWTGQPSMALINPIGGHAHVEEWRAALGQYFKIVRVFDAHAATFEACLDLLRGFGQLSETWRAPLEDAVAAIAEERARVHARVARAIAELLADAIAHSASRRISAGADSADYRESLEHEWKEALRAREREARRAVERIYGHRAIEREERPVDVQEPDLFSIDQWFLWGLNRRQLIASGAAGGAAVGGMIDAAAHGASLFAGALIGAAVGGAAAWGSSGRLAQVRVFALPLGGELLRCGPAASPNFPYVLLGRALHHHARIAGRTHAMRSPLALADEPGAKWIERIGAGARRELDRGLRALRRGEADAAAELARCIESIVAQGDAPGAR
jgi:hypothetical protein